MLTEYFGTESTARCSLRYYAQHRRTMKTWHPNGGINGSPRYFQQRWRGSPDHQDLDLYFPLLDGCGSYGLRVCGSSHSRLFAFSSVMGVHGQKSTVNAGTPDVNVAFRSIVIQLLSGPVAHPSSGGSSRLPYPLGWVCPWTKYQDLCFSCKTDPKFMSGGRHRVKRKEILPLLASPKKERKGWLGTKLRSDWH